MGYAKNKAMEEAGEKAAAWRHVAMSKCFECIRCGNYPEYDERELYFETKLCGFCAHQAAKGD